MAHRCTYSIVIADDDPNIRDALRDLLEDDPRFAVIGVTQSGTEAAELVGTQHVDLAVVDVQMPMGGTNAIAAIRTSSPNTRVAVFTANRGNRVERAMLEAGAAGVFHKGDTLDLNSALADLMKD